jgi:uncharacterized repeat protein (TIGR01451 family)
MLGFDIKRLSATGIGNNQRSATISLTSTGDRYFPGVVTTAIDIYAPDFSTSTKTVTNLSGRDPAEPGDVLEYTLTFVNTGQDPASQAVATDAIPAGTSYDPGSLEIVDGPGAGPVTDTAGDDRGEYDPAQRRIRVRLGSGGNASAGGTIGMGESTSVRFRVLVAPSAAGTTVVNAGGLSYRAVTLDRDFDYAPQPAAIPVRRLADLSIEKQTTPDPVAAGAVATSRLVVRNAGPSAAADVVVTDNLPDGVTFVSADSGQGSCSESGGRLSCRLGDVPSGQQVTVTVRFRVPAGSEDTSVANTATVDSPIADPDPDDNGAGAVVGVLTRADLSVAKTADPAEVRPGEATTYRVAVSNAGPSFARSVVVSDLVDAGLTVQEATMPGSDCGVTASSAQCTRGQLAPGATVTMTVTVLVDGELPGGEALGNTATVSSETADPDDADNFAAATVTTLAPSTNLSIRKDATAVSYAGGVVEYTLTVANSGPSAAREVVVEDDLPAGLTVTSVSTTRGQCSGTMRLRCELGTMPAPLDDEVATTRITVVAAIPAGQTPGAMANTAGVASATADPTPGDDTDAATTNVRTVADLSVTKTADPVQPSAGEEVAYTVTVSNAGPSTGRDVVLADDLPDQFSLVDVDVDAPAGVTCASTDPLWCTMTELPVGESRTVTVTMSIPPDTDLQTGVANTARVSGSGIDPSDTDNAATATVTTGAVSDLVLVKRVIDPADGPFTAGQEVTYLIGVGNVGPGAASSAQVVDVLPPGLTFVSSVPECSYDAGSRRLTCDMPNVPVQLAAVLPVTVRVDADEPEGELITNSATVRLTDPNRVDPVTSNNTDVVSRPVTTTADLSVTKESYLLALPDLQQRVQPAEAPPGAAFSFGMEVRNDGPSVAHDVVISDRFDLSETVPASVRLTRSDGSVEDLSSACELLDQEIRCNLGDVPVLSPGQEPWRVDIELTALSGATPGDFNNTVTVGTTTPESELDDNTDGATVRLLPRRATLQVDKSSDDTELVAGSTFNYLVTVRGIFDVAQYAASDAPDTVLTDVLPDGLTATSVTTTQGSCDTDGRAVECRLGTVSGPLRIPQDPPVQVRVFGTVDNAATGPIANTATADSPASDPASGSLSLPVVRRSDLSVTKTADAPTAVAGGEIGYTVVVSNAGPSTAEDVAVTDDLPPELTVVEGGTDPGFLPVAEPLRCDLDTIPAGESRTLRIVGALAPGQAPGPVTNTVRLPERPDDQDPSNDAAEVTTEVTREADLHVTKTPSAEAVAVGSTLTYALAVGNAGPSTATDVEILDSLPPGLTLVSASEEAPVACAPAGDAVRCTVPRLAPGEAATATVEVRVDEGQDSGTLENRATVSSGVPDPDPDNDAATAAVTVFILADVSIRKTVLTADPVAGRPVRLALDVTNAGPQAAPGVVVSDGLPPSLAYLSARVVGGRECSVTHPEDIDIVTCAVGRLAVGESARAVLTVRPDADLTALTNVAVVGSAALDEASADNADGVTAQLEAAATPTPTPTPTPGGGPGSSGGGGTGGSGPGPTGSSPAGGTGSAETGGSGGGRLADTGAPPLTGLLLVAGLLLLTGAVVMYRTRSSLGQGGP